MKTFYDLFCKYPVISMQYSVKYELGFIQVSKSEQFVSICGRNSNLAAITISAATFDLKQ